jgi:Cu(I)/Ag(I) efflux system protein CusF
MSRRRVLLATIAAVLGSPAFPVLAAHVVLSDGQVLSTGRLVNIDIEAKKITIEHKPIKRFYMETMIMIFRVKDAESLKGLTPGDKIRFDVERDNEGFIITKIENTN